jgi:hypothetical protein
MTTVAQSKNWKIQLKYPSARAMRPYARKPLLQSPFIGSARAVFNGGLALGSIAPDLLFQSRLHSFYPQRQIEGKRIQLYLQFVDIALTQVRIGTKNRTPGLADFAQ